MKHLKLFFALFAMLALGVSNVWAAEIVFKTNTSDATSALTTSNLKNQVTSGADYIASVGSDLAKVYQGKSGLKFGSSSAAGVLTLNLASAAQITNPTITIKSAKYNNKAGSFEIFVNGSTSATATATAGADLTFTYTGTITKIQFKSKKPTSGDIRAYLSSINIVGGSTTEPTVSLTANPATIDFGTVYQGETVENKTVAVNFENLTGNVTYSGLSSPFTATGTINTTGDEITIAADASAVGEYSQTLTIESTADSKTAEVTVKMNVVEKPDPTGTFTLHTGTLIEGDYVIYYNGKAMKAEKYSASTNRLNNVEVTPVDGKIENPDALVIWHIAPSDTIWTIYNNDKGYAAGNGTKNNAILVTDLTDDNAKKAAWKVTGSDTYEFVNVWNADKEVNKNLRNNGTSGWACYSTSTGGALSLYRKAGTKYNVNVSATTNGTVTASPTSAEAGTTIALTVTPSTGYVLDALTVTDANSNTVTVIGNTFTMPASDVTVTATFKVNEKPAATLTLNKNGVTEDITGYKQDDVVTLPSITSDCVKEFVGWSANPTCNVAPEYAAGDSYPLAATSQTLYAVYANVEGGGNVTIKHNSTTTTNMSGNNDAKTFFDLDETQWSLVSAKGSASNHIGVNKDGNLRFYYHADGGSTLTITAPKTIATVVLTFDDEKNNAWVKVGGNTITPVDGVYTINATEFVIGNANTSNTQVYLAQIDVTLQGSYSNYSTTCAAALANPTFSLSEGKYTEKKIVTISATEGTIYYTLDGTTPTSASTQYTSAIALDECGEHTIKAIAISSDSQSEVVSATYTIKLPLTNSQAAPYTEAEAITVYDGGCYDNQDVYVKGTVKTATFYTSGTYTITLTNGFQFYKFYKDGSNATFTDGDINAGDVLLACGKLDKYNSTYQLAAGCYLVEHEPYTGVKTDISNTEATAYTVDKAFALIADVSSDLTKEVYVKGIVAVAPTSNPTTEGKMTYSISDNGENTGNVLKVYLGLGLEGATFTSKEDVKHGDYVVAKGLLLDYYGTYEMTNSQLKEHIKAVTITIADITMEVGATTTISATVEPAATITYTIKENTANAITLSGSTIIANAVGTATITATVADGATYMGNSVDFTVTVTNVATKDNVVILAQYQGQWYAMKAEKGSGSNSLAALPVEYINGKLYNVAETDKASITWERASYDGKATFKNGENYPTGTSTGTALTLETTACDWTYNGVTYMIGNRTFLYNKGGYFKNYATSNAGGADYSSLPEVVAPVYATAEIYTREGLTVNNHYTICLPYGSSNFSGAEFYEVSSLDPTKGLWLDGLTAGASLEAGKPYIFKATSEKIAVVYEGTKENAPIAGANGLTGTFTNIAANADLVDNYIIAENKVWVANDQNTLPANRAYINATLVPKKIQPVIPGRQRVCMGENATTGIQDIVLPEGQVMKVIENGQLIIIRDGVKYNVQGQKL